MLNHAFVHVDRDARVVSIIATKHNVEAELSIHHCQALPPTSLSPNIRNAPASILSWFSVVSAQVKTISAGDRATALRLEYRVKRMSRIQKEALIDGCESLQKLTKDQFSAAG